MNKTDEKPWKCVCMKHGAYFNNSRLKKGEIFYIYPRKGKRDPQKGMIDDMGHYEDIVLTCEQQYSKRWMRRLKDDINEEEDQEHNDQLYANAQSSDKVIKKLAKNMVEIDEDDAPAPVVEKTVTKKTTKKKAAKKTAKVEAPVEVEEEVI